ncbi:MAG: DNA repair protein RecO [Acidobacteria bacterium]|nr:DNA repair protein RecO [Acidobacteriota bacterium]
MALVSTTAFILKLDPLSEKDLVVALLTKDHGVVRAAVRGARGKSKRAAALQLLTEVSLTYFRKEGADLARVDGLEIVKSAYDLAVAADAAMLLPYVAESALTFVPESELGGDVYRLVRHVLDALEAGVPAPLATRYFETWLLRFAGVLDEEEVAEPARGVLASMRRFPLLALAKKPPPAGALESLEDLLREARRSFLGHELKSYRFLQSLG